MGDFEPDLRLASGRNGLEATHAFASDFPAPLEYPITVPIMNPCAIDRQAGYGLSELLHGPVRAREQ